VVSDSTPPTFRLAFFPWLRLKAAVAAGPYNFVPFDEVGLRPFFGDLLAGYRNYRSERVVACTMVTNESWRPSWNLPAAEQPALFIAAQDLMLSTMSINEIHRPHRPQYSNTVMHGMHLQLARGLGGHLAVGFRERDGRTLDGGYTHGDIVFSAPPQYRREAELRVNTALLTSLTDARRRSPATAARIHSALGLFTTANTDWEGIPESSEVVSMGACFEILLEANSAYTVAKHLGELFRGFDRATVEDALPSRPEVRFNQPEYKAVQLKWPLKKKWVEELHQRRSSIVHGFEESFAWSDSEHLEMAAHVFPLACKLLLAREDLYLLTKEDRWACASIDPILADTDWGADDSFGTRWRRIETHQILHEVASEAMAGPLPPKMPD